MVLTSCSFRCFFPPFIKLYFISVFADHVTDLLVDFNPPEVSTPALGWGIGFHFLPHAL